MPEDLAIPPDYPSWVEAPGTRWWIPEGMAGGPDFSVKEAGKIFFRKSGSWLRMRMQPTPRHPHGWFTDEDGYPLDIQRRQGADASYSFRRFDLATIERMAWSAYRHEIEDLVAWYQENPKTGKRGEHRALRYRERAADSVRHLVIAIELVKWEARLYGLIPDEAPRA